MKYIDNFLDRITMYRVVLYYLIFLLSYAVLLCFIHRLQYSPLNILISAGLILFFSLITNSAFSKAYEAPTNVESVYITALILALIVTPMQNLGDAVFLAWTGILSMASKYILAIGRKHIFNPVAIAVVLTSYGLNQSASWWVGNSTMVLPVLIGGLLVVRKIQREKLIASFFLTTLSATALVSIMNGTNTLAVLDKVVIHSPLFFFAFAMLTEPLTTPHTQLLQIAYGSMVGLFYTPYFRISGISFTPEMALIAGNIFSYLVSPKEKLLLYLRERIRISSDTFDFIFTPSKKFSYVPGQYMEWTLPHENPDTRGNRRFFTLASSPTENNIRLGIKFYEKGSSYKKALLGMDGDLPMMAGQRAGDFTLPRNKNEKLAFIAGGIGITPFRSMLKYLCDKKERRDIVLFYSNKNEGEIAYRDILLEAEKTIGAKIVYALTDVNSIQPGWKGEKGRIGPDMIATYLPDYLDRLFYLSGPHAMVTAFEKVLLGMGIPEKKIVKDFFPGFV